MGLFSRNKGKKEEEQKPVEEEPEKTVPVKKTAPKPAAKPVAKPKEVPKTEKPSGEDTAEKGASEKSVGSYFVSPHPDGGWQVKKAKAKKALKRFKTKAEAEAYAKQVAKNQGTKVVRQKKDGKIQKEKY